MSIAICAQAFRRRSAVEEKRGPGAEGTGCSGLQRMPASAEEVMSGSEEEDAGPPPMMREDDGVVLSAFVQPVSEKVAADVVHAR